MIRLLTGVVVLGLGLLLGAGQPAQAEQVQAEVGTLVYFGAEHCPYCRRFEHEVAEVYPKTAMSKKLPLVQVDHDHPPAQYEKLNRKVTFVPSFFILGDAGQIKARFIGYRGEEFWWYDLEDTVAKLEGTDKTHAALQ
ncbi:TlpA family protein disulfide reductase [Magnetococcus sp. PR-3]|uniref:TlpA family protein disulfide reductase n=1 Tax=Magnetococcus sp. PR-3 TaxID=3120355 RepID=UPI002FCE171B